MPDELDRQLDHIESMAKWIIHEVAAIRDQRRAERDERRRRHNIRGLILLPIAGAGALWTVIKVKPAAAATAGGAVGLTGAAGAMTAIVLVLQPCSAETLNEAAPGAVVSRPYSPPAAATPSRRTSPPERKPPTMPPPTTAPAPAPVPNETPSPPPPPGDDKVNNGRGHGPPTARPPAKTPPPARPPTRRKPDTPPSAEVTAECILRVHVGDLRLLCPNS